MEQTYVSFAPISSSESRIDFNSGTSMTGLISVQPKVVRSYQALRILVVCSDMKEKFTGNTVVQGSN